MRDVPNFADLVRDNAAGNQGERPALCWRDRCMTWSELDAQVDAVAAALRRLTADADGQGGAGQGGAGQGGAGQGGAGQGGAGGADAPPRVAIALPNLPEYAAAYFGTLRAGLVAVPVNPAATRRELEHVIADAGVAVLIGVPAVLDALAGARLPVRYAYQVGSGAPGERPAGRVAAWLAGRRPFADLLAPAGPAGRPAPDRPAEPDADGGDRPAEPDAVGGDLAVLLYTSGTAGTPRGAMLSHRALLANHAQLARLDPAPVTPDDRVLLAVPLWQAYGLNCGLGTVAYHGACGVLAEHTDAAGALEQIVRHRVTAVVGLPTTYAAWSAQGAPARDAFAGVRLAVTGSAPLDAATAERFATLTGRRPYEGYGLTETGPVVATTLASPEPKRGSIGRPIPGVEVRLVDVSGGEIATVDASGGSLDAGDDDSDDASPGTPGTDPGEIVVRGGNLFSGYWPDGADGPDAEGWWATGDVAYADADGDLFLVDRRGELIVVSGFNVYPHEIERVLAGYPGVAEAAVLGTPEPGGGQAVRAFVVREPGATVTAEQLLEYCERNLARFKCPSRVEFVPALPRSPSGRVRKAGLGEDPG